MEPQRKLLYKILAVVAGVVLIGVGLNDNHHLSRLKRFGSTAEVIPPDSYTDHSQNGSHTFTGVIRFKTDGGSEVTQNHEIPSKALDSMKAGDKVLVYYDPKDPTDFVFAQEDTDYIVPGAGVALIIGALVFI